MLDNRLVNWKTPYDSHRPDKKECTICGEEKPLEDFRKRPEANDGRYSQCIMCEKEKRNRVKQLRRADIRTFF